MDSLPGVTLSVRTIAIGEEPNCVLAGAKGIWETLQDSAGDYVRAEDKSVVRYRKFCEQISRVEERAGLLRVLDFYREIHGRGEERKSMIES